MHLFRHENRQRTAGTRRLYAQYEIAYTIVDFCAAISFLAGSVLFFWNRFELEAIWLFVIGSLCFTLKPTIRLAREIHLYRRGRLEPLAERVQE
jgi:hypothetical protein